MFGIGATLEEDFRTGLQPEMAKDLFVSAGQGRQLPG